MKNSSFNYSFMLSLSTENLELKVGFRSFVSTDLPMLDLRDSPTGARQFSATLEAVVKGERDEHRWGRDLFDVISKQEISTIYHHYGADGLNLKYNIETEVPTAILLKMVKDWALFLESMPKELLGKRTIE